MTIHEDSLEKELVFDCVTGRYKNLEEVLLRVIAVLFIVGDLLLPLLEHMSHWINALFVDVNLRIDVSLELCDLLSEVDVELVAIYIMDIGS